MYFLLHMIQLLHRMALLLMDQKDYAHHFHTCILVNTYEPTG